MKLTALLALSIIASVSSALAQTGSDIERTSYNVANDIRRYGSQLSTQQRDSIASHLQAINDIIYGAAPGLASYSCVPRDNDGRNPWILASLDGRGGLAKLDGTITQTIQAG